MSRVLAQTARARTTAATTASPQNRRVTGHIKARALVIPNSSMNGCSSLLEYNFSGSVNTPSRGRTAPIDNTSAIEAIRVINSNPIVCALRRTVITCQRRFKSLVFNDILYSCIGSRLTAIDVSQLSFFLTILSRRTLPHQVYTRLGLGHRPHE